MIELTTHYASGAIPVVHRFSCVTSLTTYLITFSESLKAGLVRFEVRENAECFEHDWKYIPLTDRETDANFNCRDCPVEVLVDSSILERLLQESRSAL